MKKISYTEVKRGGSKGKGRTSKRKLQKAKALNITSLIDILTILLIFLIQDVSMTAQKNDPPKGMTLPETATVDSLMENAFPILIKVFGRSPETYANGQILFGTESRVVGDLDAFITDEGVRLAMLGMLQEASEMIKNADNEPIILIQADNNVENRYISEIVAACAAGKFENIYFSSTENSGLWSGYTGL